MSDHQDKPSPIEQETTPVKKQHWLIGLTNGFFVMAFGAIYGVFSYRLFDHLFSSPEQHASGLMLASFVLGVPASISAIVAYLLRRSHKMKLGTLISISTFTIFVTVFLAGALLREGFICIVMALPIFIVLGLIGAIIGWLFSFLSKDQSPKAIGIFVLLPFVFGAMEEHSIPSSRIHTIKRSVLIHASPAIIWQHINFPLAIAPEELKGGFAYEIGMPYPVEARVSDAKIGGIRHSVWQRGVQFQEQITAIEDQRFIAWKYIFSPSSFPEGSLDDHIVIGGKYFNLENTSYTLTPVAQGTRLDIAVEYKVSTHFNWYASRWADFLISDTAEVILNFYKNRSEKKA